MTGTLGLPRSRGPGQAIAGERGTAVDGYLAEVAAGLPGPGRARATSSRNSAPGSWTPSTLTADAGLPRSPGRRGGYPRVRRPGPGSPPRSGPGSPLSQARRVALTLLATGPLIGLLWAAAAVASHIGIRHGPALAVGRRATRLAGGLPRWPPPPW